MTALMLAAMHGDTEILEVLLEAEAVTDVQDKVLTASLSRTVHGPLHICCFFFVQAGRTALMWATAKGHTTTVVRLLTAGANADLQATPVACFASRDRNFHSRVLSALVFGRAAPRR
jgi:ankyrin repeat protein